MNYTDLREGDHLPAVGVLQQLLNRTGALLVPDGVFGPRTLAAVKNFQKPRGLVADGIVGEKTWARLTTGVKLPIFDSIDVWDPTFFKQDAAYVQKVGGHPLMIGGMCNGVEQIVSQLSGLTNVFLLRFHGHGAPGVASGSSGHGELDPKMRELSDIWGNPTIVRILGRLAQIFGPYGCIQFIECQTGAGAKGRLLLRKLADQLGVPVTGAVRDQPFGRLWTFRLSGPTVTVVPGAGSLSDWCKSLPPSLE
jgi:Putative peptidoglycan binding domain